MKIIKLNMLEICEEKGELKPQGQLVFNVENFYCARVTKISLIDKIIMPNGATLEEGKKHSIFSRHEVPPPHEYIYKYVPVSTVYLLNRTSADSFLVGETVDEIYALINGASK